MDEEENITTRPNFFLRSGRNRVDLLSYESKMTDKQEQYDWRAEKIWTVKALVRKCYFELISYISKSLHSDLNLVIGK